MQILVNNFSAELFCPLGDAKINSNGSLDSRLLPFSSLTSGRWLKIVFQTRIPELRRCCCCCGKNETSSSNCIFWRKTWENICHSGFNQKCSKSTRCCWRENRSVSHYFPDVECANSSGRSVFRTPPVSFPRLIIEQAHYFNCERRWGEKISEWHEWISLTEHLCESRSRTEEKEPKSNKERKGKVASRPLENLSKWNELAFGFRTTS